MECESCKEVCRQSEISFEEGPKIFKIALAGNPNTGKSTVFNALTGLKQHTGNWPGKTVTSARGKYYHKGCKFNLVDLPGTYSLLANSMDEEVARDFICFGRPDATIVVVDATCLERNLNLALQVLEITDKVILCVNLMDEAKRKGIDIDVLALERELGIPVVPATARDGIGLDILKDKVYEVASETVINSPPKIKYSEEIEKVIERLEPEILKSLKGSINARWVALRLIEGDQSFINSLCKGLRGEVSGYNKK